MRLEDFVTELLKQSRIKKINKNIKE